MSELETELEKLEAERNTLLDRLDKGAFKIQEARYNGRDVTGWEDFWLELNRKYEAICERIDELSKQL